MNLFFISYLLNPKFSHRFVGYLEEEAVKTYTTMIEEMEKPKSCLSHLCEKKPSQEIKAYYQLGEDATYSDVIKCIRADEAIHRNTNHYLASVDQDIEIPEEFVRVINENQKAKEKEEKKSQEQSFWHSMIIQHNSSYH